MASDVQARSCGAALLLASAAGGTTVVLYLCHRRYALSVDTTAGGTLRLDKDGIGTGISSSSSGRGGNAGSAVHDERRCGLGVTGSRGEWPAECDPDSPHHWCCNGTHCQGSCACKGCRDSRVARRAAAVYTSSTPMRGLYGDPGQRSPEHPWPIDNDPYSYGGKNPILTGAANSLFVDNCTGTQACAVPKAGTTFMDRCITELQKQCQGWTAPPEDIPKHWAALWANSSSTRVLLVRDPLERLISGFIHLCTDVVRPAAYGGQFCPFPPRQPPFCHLTSAPPTEDAMERFLAHLVWLRDRAGANRTFLPGQRIVYYHFRPHVQTCGGRAALSGYTHVVGLGPQLTQQLRTVFRVANKTINQGMVHSVRSTDWSRRLVRSKRMAARLLSFYAEDYAQLALPYPSWLAELPGEAGDPSGSYGLAALDAYRDPVSQQRAASSARTFTNDPWCAPRLKARIPPRRVPARKKIR